MKHVLLFVLFFCGLFSFPPAYSNQTGMNFSGIEEEEMVLHGSFQNNPLRSLSMPFSVTKTANQIIVDYLQSLTNITLTVLNEYGDVMYYDIVSPSINGQLVINISNWEEGSYTISFSNNSGGCIYGNFEIQ
ncbi:hypothetical protein FACS189432_02850 [Bacteroidia bacterium]|nr:hypothetical protein FACS189426_19160 [Bacteroidia bacterium]GHT27089.1 hypothetical protein FACS189432_02850 [Bacteroidia bacterium]GHV71135.1 hypothetical protein FACS189420_5080 [Bacteroidia bacterium]